MVHVDVQRHTPVQIIVVLLVLLVAAAISGFFYFLEQEKAEHQAQIAALDRQAVLALFDEAFIDGDVDRALTQAIIITETYPDDSIGSLYEATARLQRARLYRSAPEDVQQIESSLRVVESTQRYVDELARLLGVAYYQAGQYERAVETLATAQGSYPQNALLAATYGSVLMHVGSFEQAEEMLEYTLALNENQPTALLAQAELRIRTNASATSTLALLERTHEHTRNASLRARAYVLAGHVSYAAGQYDRALLHFTDAVAYDTGNYDALIGIVFSNLAIAAGATQPTAESIDRIDDALRLFERVYTGDAQGLLAQAAYAALQNKPKEQRLLLERARNQLATATMLTDVDRKELMRFSEEQLASEYIGVLPLMLSAAAPIEHCSTCGQ